MPNHVANVIKMKGIKNLSLFSTAALMDVNFDCNFDDLELEKLWKMFGDIPVGGGDEIQEEFLDFPEGTDRIEIWHWFDDRHSKGVAYLMYGENGRKKICKRCGAEVWSEKGEELRKEYPYYCPKCDENMYSFECEEV